MAHKIPGVVHVDNSARIQTVTEAGNGRYYQLIRESINYRCTDIDQSLIQQKGMPIIETPTQALTYFFECALDCLVLGNYIIYKD